MSLKAEIRGNELLETFKDAFGAYSTIRWSNLGQEPDAQIRSWVQHFTNEEATQYHRSAARVYAKQ